MTAYANVETAVEAMKKGAADYLQKPVDLDELNLRLEKILILKSAVDDASNLREAMAVTEKTASQTIQDLEMLVAGLEERCSEVEAILSNESLDFDERVAMSLEQLASRHK
jgi:DNA-binding NtrC family response regulator